MSVFLSCRTCGHCQRRSDLPPVACVGRKSLTAFEDVGRVRVRAAHVDGEASIGREQGLLPLGVAPVGAVSVGIEQLADGKAVRGFGGTDLGVNSHERRSRELRRRPGGLARNMGTSSGEFPGLLTITGEFPV
jgi:hypothetical protein